MHTPIYLVKDLNLFLKNIIQTILKNSALLVKGKKIANINLLPREVLGLFILCTVARHLDPDNEWTIGSDRFGGDGVLACTAGEKKNIVLDTEQVYHLFLRETLLL